MLEDEKYRKKAKATIKSLAYPEMFHRRHAIPNDDYESLDWLFQAESQKYPQLTDLKNFLSSQSDLFWIQGKPASGKSTFMKFLLDCTRGRDKLGQWSGTKEVHFATHFCWIAGTPMQRSQQGLLQSLLYQILLSNLALIPIACASRCTANVSPGSWYEGELWEPLFAAVAASDKRVCFFIDGLDEIEPDTSHKALALAIRRLGCYDNAKIVVSSRPWPDFERCLYEDGKVMVMENVNSISIASYVRNRLVAITLDYSFARVAWDCIHPRNHRNHHWTHACSHGHGDAHAMVVDVMDKADGVFL